MSDASEQTIAVDGYHAHVYRDAGPRPTGGRVRHPPGGF
jgi:aromatic ring-cleaving dioxygenase